MANHRAPLVERLATSILNEPAALGHVLRGWIPEGAELGRKRRAEGGRYVPLRMATSLAD